MNTIKVTHYSGREYEFEVTRKGFKCLLEDKEYVDYTHEEFYNAVNDNLWTLK